MKQLLDVLQRSIAYLQQKRPEAPRYLVEQMIAGAIGLKRLDLYVQHDRPLESKELDLIRERLVRLAAGEPLQYIEGTVSFGDCTISVNPAVLIPRQETELLVEQVAEMQLPGVRCLDLCCGSGCMGIALKKRLPQLEVVLADVSEAALEVARANAQANGVEVEVCQGDLFGAVKGRQFDLLVCNPPYVTAHEYEALDPSVRGFEPRLALVGGADGLDFYRRIAREAGGYLAPGALLALEIGWQQGEAVRQLFDGYEGVCVKQDLAAKDRFVIALMACLVPSPTLSRASLVSCAAPNS